jgi:hypothetical protein
MIYENLYRAAGEEFVNNWITKYNELIPAARNMEQIHELLNEVDRVTGILNRLKQEEPPAFSFDVKQALHSYFGASIDEYDKTIAEIKSKADEDIRVRTKEYENAMLEAEQNANKDIQPLIDKHNELLGYKDKLHAMLIGYNITPTDIAIDSEISRQEYETLLDVSLDVCRKLTKSHGLKIMDFFKKEQEGSNDSVAELVLMVVCLWVLSPLLFVGMYVYMYVNTARIYKAVDKLRIAQSIMYDTDLERYLKKNMVTELPELITADIEDERDSVLASMIDNDPRIKLEEEGRAFASNLEQVQNMYEKYTNMVRSKHNQAIDATENYLKELQIYVEETKSKLKPFGTYINETPVFDTLFTLGRDRGILDIKYDLGLRNIIFKATGEDMIEFIKLMLCNALLNVQAKSLHVRIYDPNNLGAAFSEFFKLELQEYIDVVTSDLEKQVTELRAYAQQNVKTVGKRTVNEYNKECFDIGKVTIDYKILIIMSGAKKVQEMETLAEFMKYSAQYGVFVWLYSMETLNDVLHYEAPYGGVECPLHLTSELLSSVLTVYTKAVVEGKGAALPYVTKFVRKIIPEGKDWTYSTNKGIGLNFGFEGGDPSKGYEIYLGDRAVHALMVGTTGAGKSATINQVLMSLLRKYSPKELELVMIDFKNVEFASFTNPETGISKIPHAKIIAGTKDGEYAISIFEYLCAEMDRRTELFSKAGKTNIEGYNNWLRETGRESECLPRILLLVDEFQVMFTEVDQKSVDIISKSITSLSKLARFCGCHMWFTSQSMKGTLSKDIMDQFVLRIALFCSKDTSEAIIGSRVAGEMKSKVGWLYTNTAMGEDKSATKLWRVPYLDKDSDLPGQLEFLDKLGTENGIVSHKALFYDEDKQHHQDELLQVYRNNAGFKDYPRLLVLGERTGYSLNKAPINFNLMLDNFENIVVAAFEQHDALNLAMTMIDNVIMKEGAKLLIHSADKDTYTLLEAERYLQEGLIPMSLPSFEFGDWVDALEKILESRSERGRNELTPIFFLAIQWDKYQGFGIDENYRLVDRMKNILRQGPTLGVHFVFLLRSLKDFQTSLLGNFNHRISAKVNENDSYKMLDSTRASKLPASGGFAIYSYGSVTHKFKIYQHKFSRELEKREIVL